MVFLGSPFRRPVGWRVLVLLGTSALVSASSRDALADEPLADATTLSDGRLAVVVVEGINATAFRQTLQDDLAFPIVALTDSRATATSRRLLVVVSGTQATFSLEDFGANVWTESVELPHPVEPSSEDVPNALRAAAVPLLRRASSPLFRRAEVLNPFEGYANTFETEELVNPFPPSTLAVIGSQGLDWLAGELLNPFESNRPSGTRPAPSGVFSLGQTGSPQRLGRPRPSIPR